MSALRMCQGCDHNADPGHRNDCAVTHAQRARYLNKGGTCPIWTNLDLLGADITDPGDVAELTRRYGPRAVRTAV